MTDMKKIFKNIYNRDMTSDTNGRIYYFDNLKFILIFLVVLGHFLDPLTGKSNYAKGLWLFIYFFHMPLFIFVSGYFAKNSIKKKNKEKVFIFLILYVILSFLLFCVSKFICNENVKLSILKVKSIPWYLLAMAVWYSLSMAFQNANKKSLLIITIALALIIGYDKEFGDYMAISRIIVFYPFFLLGMMAEKEKLDRYVINNKFKLLLSILLIIIAILFVLFVDKLYFLKPLTTARNSYFSLSDNIENYGILFRGLWYIISCLISIIVMMAVPRGKAFFSKFGERTLAVYFWHAIVVKIVMHYNINWGVKEYIVLSLIVTFILSFKVFSLPIERINKIKISEK